MKPLLYLMVAFRSSKINDNDNDIDNESTAMKQPPQDAEV
jgi:hypothetical protein